MTQDPRDVPAAPPYAGQAPPQPAVGPAPRRRRRPSGWWFAVGGALITAAVVAFVALFAWTLSSVVDVEETVAADGLPHPVSLSGTDQRMVWGRSEDGTDCTIVDTATGEEVDYSPVVGTLTKQDGSGSWTGIVNFQPGSGELVVTCLDAGGPVQIGPATEVTSFVGRIFATILVPLALGGFGTIVLVVTGVLFARGEPRRPAG